MDYVKISIFVAIAYLIGNISPSTIIARLYGLDIKKEGSGNAGTTNVLRVLGAKAALATLAIDIIKGFVAVTLGQNNCGRMGAMACFVAVVFGHIYPALYKFKGGKGIATSFGAAWAINWPSAFAAMAIAIVAAGSSRKMSVGSLAAAIAYPLLILYYYPKILPVAIFMAVVLVFTHRTNIKRLIKGEESELRFRRKKEEDSLVEEVPAGEPGSVVSEPACTCASCTCAEAEEPQAQPEEVAPVDHYAGEKKVRLKAEDKLKIAVLGNGSFGTSVANLLAHNGHNVMLYGRDKEAVEEMRETRVNARHLPGILLHEKIKYTAVLKTAASGRDLVVFAVPAQQFRAVAKKAARYLAPEAIVVNLAKGIEIGSKKALSSVAGELFPNRYVALSGPSHAEEIARNCPTTVVVASCDHEAAKLAQNAFMRGVFRVYTSRDLTGVELGGALKNVIAIGTGIADGMKFGDNTKAAIMTRGIHEITRLGTTLGAEGDTFAGLSGIGDLMVTCASDLSRNRRCGILIGEGRTPEAAVEEVGATVEGFYTVEAASALAAEHGVEMPITEAVKAVIEGSLAAEDAVRLLMERDKKEETK